MTLGTFPYDTAEFLDTGEDIALFAEAILEDDDPQTFRRALDVIARAYGFARIAEEMGLPRRRLIEALRDPENDASGVLKAVLAAESAKLGREAAE